MISMEPVFPIALDLRGAPGGLSHALQTQLRDAITDGRLHAGMRLPSTRAAAQALGIGRNTVIAAYDRLVAEGYVIARPGAAPEVLPTRAATAKSTGLGESDAARHLSSQWKHRTPDPEHALEGADSFRTGMPDARHFPHDRWRQLMQRSLRSLSRKAFVYPPSEGIRELREAIARHVAFTRAVSCNADDVIVTAGATQAFDMLARVFVEPGQSRVAIESPGYPPLARAFRTAGAEIVAVPVDEQGLCIEALPRNVGVVCVTPSHQSPLGMILSQARRRALLDHAERWDSIVIEDDYDGEFRYGGRPLDSLQTLNSSARVFYVGTFSKNMFPSLRLGFIIAPRWARNALVAAKQLSDPHANDILQATLAAFISEGDLARHIRRMQRIYAERRDVILHSLAGPLFRYLSVVPSEAGLHLAANLRDGVDQGRLIAAATRHLPGITTIAHYAQTTEAQPGLLFGFGCISATEAAASLQAFSSALRRR